jgi:hypothetical protein
LYVGISKKPNISKYSVLAHRKGVRLKPHRWSSYALAFEVHTDMRSRVSTCRSHKWLVCLSIPQCALSWSDRSFISKTEVHLRELCSKTHKLGHELVRSTLCASLELSQWNPCTINLCK